MGVRGFDSATICLGDIGGKEGTDETCGPIVSYKCRPGAADMSVLSKVNCQYGVVYQHINYILKRQWLFWQAIKKKQLKFLKCGK